MCPDGVPNFVPGPHDNCPLPSRTEPLRAIRPRARVPGGSAPAAALAGAGLPGPRFNAEGRKGLTGTAPEGSPGREAAPAEGWRIAEAGLKPWPA
jgi:hypothetical protein